MSVTHIPGASTFKHNIAICLSKMPFHFTKDNSFYITLEHAVRRQAHMRQQFQYFGMEVTQWTASTPSTLTDSFHWALNPCEKACAQSHVNIWKHVIANEIEYAFIMEDDVCFAPIVVLTETRCYDCWEKSIMA